MMFLVLSLLPVCSAGLGNGPARHESGGDFRLNCEQALLRNQLREIRRDSIKGQFVPVRVSMKRQIIKLGQSLQILVEIT